jgi:sorbitol-specific phosphotransferase system component IIC
MSATQPTAQSNFCATQSKARLWTGRIITSLVVLFVLFDGVTKLVKEGHVLNAAAELGYSANAMVWIGLLLLACTAVYVIPRTAVLGTVLLTGYLGGAVASNVRIAHPAFECVFPIIFGVLVWAGLLLREPRLRVLLPLTTQSAR